MEALTLYELNSLVRQVLEQTLQKEYWVEAELSECRTSRGHCYMELVEKNDRSNTPIARASAKCWQNTWSILQPYFERTTGQSLHAGLKVRLKVYAQFHEAYGFSWIVTDIDPTFTLGDMARKQQEIIRQLKTEGIFDLQKSLNLPLFCLRVAVISSATAAGYGDFVNQLADSPYNFHTRLFPAIMQGEQVEQSIIAALNRIYDHIDEFDSIVIIRGGGATADLSGFNTLALAENVAQFPIPIITGIGHDRDESILDMVSHTRVKTPTAAAQFLISHLDLTQRRIDACKERLTRYAQNKMETERLRMARLAERIPGPFTIVKTREEARLQRLMQTAVSLTGQQILHERQRCEKLQIKCTTSCEQQLLKEQHRLSLLTQRTKAFDPTLLLKRGYSITLCNGKALCDPATLQAGDQLETLLEQGIVYSTVTSTQQNNQ
ncbi:MAG: exodeoxyribonuclease VII large subunit [Prevotella sp.]|nr:exodeoxyribonuclease VII large subunit [Prevotella sp.]